MLSTSSSRLRSRRSENAFGDAQRGTGALGLYSVFRSGVGINRIAGRPLAAVGPLRDIDLQVGMNLETKSTDYAPQERSLFFGPNLQFRVGAVPQRRVAAPQGVEPQRAPGLKLDISPIVGWKARVLELGVGFEYWHNIFGKDAEKVPGAKQFTPVFTVAVHLPLVGSGH